MQKYTPVRHYDETTDSQMAKMNKDDSGCWIHISDHEKELRDREALIVGLQGDKDSLYNTILKMSE